MPLQDIQIKNVSKRQVTSEHILTTFSQIYTLPDKSPKSKQSKISLNHLNVQDQYNDNANITCKSDTLWERLKTALNNDQADHFYHKIQISNKTADKDSLTKSLTIALNTKLWQQELKADASTEIAKTLLATTALAHYNIDVNFSEEDFPYENLSNGPNFTGLLNFWLSSAHEFKIIKEMNQKSDDSQFYDTHEEKDTFLVHLMVNKKKFKMTETCSYENIFDSKENIAKKYVRNHWTKYHEFLKSKQNEFICEEKEGNGENAGDAGNTANTGSPGNTKNPQATKTPTPKTTPKPTIQPNNSLKSSIKGQPIYLNYAENEITEFTEKSLSETFGNCSVEYPIALLHKFCQKNGTSMSFEVNMLYAGEVNAELTVLNKTFTGVGKSKKIAKQVAASAMIFYLDSQKQFY